MKRLTLVLLLLSCGQAIHIPEASVVAATPRLAPEVDVCVLYQERGLKPRFAGVAELSFAPWDYAIASILVKHPSGLTIIDPAFGTDIGESLLRAGPTTRLIFGDGSTKTPLRNVLEKSGVDPADVHVALTTHLHWDHTGGLGDLPNARVLVSRADLDWVRPFHRFLVGGVMPHHLARVKHRLSTFAFSGPPHEGFTGSFDVFGDGSVVAVPAPGHTPGSTAFFVRGRGGRTYLFSGDASWTSRGVELPAHKNPLVAFLDSDRAQLGDTLGLLHAFFKFRPDVTVVPAHDASALAALPDCTTIEHGRPRN